MSPLLARIRELMGQSGIKPKQLTAELGISNSSFTDWGKGKGSPSLDTVAKIADYFHVSIDYLVRGEEFTAQKGPGRPKQLEFPNSTDRELLEKFRRLPPELQGKLMGYLDGMLSFMPVQDGKEEKLPI